MSKSIIHQSSSRVGSCVLFGLPDKKEKDLNGFSSSLLLLLINFFFYVRCANGSIQKIVLSQRKREHYTL